MTVFFSTLGCKLNQSETEALATAFLAHDFSIAPSASSADIVIINTCTVTAKSDAKARHLIRSLQRRAPGALFIVTGCYAQVEGERLASLFPFPLAVVPQAEKSLLLGLPEALRAAGNSIDFSVSEKRGFLDEYLKKGRKEPGDSFSLSEDNSVFHARAWLKIQDGCDNACAYCRVPLARGTSISLDREKVMEKIKRLIDGGFYEIVFTGVNISAYESSETDLVSLVEYAVTHTQNVRFRLSSLEPQALTARLTGVLAHESVCPHFHIPIQSGSDRILLRMRRTYRAQVLIEGIARLRAAKPDAFIAGDVIVGFPGETDGDFEQTRRLLREAGLARLHVFPFSPRPGTIAFGMKERIAEAVIKNRVKLLLEDSNAFHKWYLAAWAGKQVDVILEKKAGPGSFYGSSAHSVKCLVEKLPQAAMQKKLRVIALIRESTEPCRALFQAVWEGKSAFIS